MSIVIRAATAADQRLISALVRSARLNPIRLVWPNFLIAQQMEADKPPRVVGLGQLRPHGDGTLELASLAVVPEAQGRGVGRQLVEALIRKADRPLYLMCRDDKVAYYQRFGFVELTEPSAIPRSMRTIYWLARGMEKIVGLFTQKMPRLAIMAHPGL